MTSLVDHARREPPIVESVMSYNSQLPVRYQALRRTGRALARTAPIVTFGVWAVGVGLFLDQSRDLVSDAQFTWGERRVMAAVAAVTIGGFILAGWVAGRLVRAAADLADVLADLGESSWRTGDMIEMHVIPLLGRIAAALERPTADRGGASPGNTGRPTTTRRPGSDSNQGPFGR